MSIDRLLYVAFVLFVLSGTSTAAELMPGFQRSPYWNEQVRDGKTAEGIRFHIIAPEVMRADRPTTVIFYATPNGNTIEQTLGCKMTPGLDWHFDIQHIAAQTRLLREVSQNRNIVLACVEAQGLSWPSWRAKHADNPALIRTVIEDTIRGLPGKDIHVIVSGHSGGGSMITGFINSADSILPYVNRIAYLDANYSYSDAEKHGDKLIAWLKADPSHVLVVMCYDDRNITLNGKLVNGPQGGTYRATERMRARFASDITLSHTTEGDIDRYTGLDGRVTFIVHRNPQNKILHTALIGDMNGFLEAMALNTPEHDKWGKFGPPRAYEKYIQPAETPAAPAAKPEPAPVATIPTPAAPSPPGTGGIAILTRLAPLTRQQREEVLVKEIMAGNVPPFMSKFVPVNFSGLDTKGKTHIACFWVSPDYVSVGTDKDFVRVPLTPMAAQPLADSLNCSLPTRKMSDEIYKRAEVKLEPRPMTKDRETVDTFLQHNAIIEEQRKGERLGALVGGIKKDVCITNLLQQRTHRVAIYGWHQLSGVPIQPLTTVHVDWYVDYSHGIRLIKRQMTVDGKTRDLWDVLKDPDLCALVSDEGPVPIAHY